MQVVERIASLLIVCLYFSSGYTQTNNCGLQKFQCRNGECIVDELLCDGTAHCKDWSDETEAECTKILCRDYAFRCDYGACINGDSVCNGIQDCVDNSDETQPQCRTTDTSNQTSQLTQNSHSVVIRATRTCIVPPQPQNGYWRLHYLQCSNKQECDVPQGTELSVASNLVYSCNPGHNMKGSRNVFCRNDGQWSDIPVCIVCGKLLADVTPFMIGGVVRNITAFPWHASMYRDEPDEPKKYFCEASIIQDNLLMTAAHCVYDENTKQVTNKRIYILTGNTFRDYDSPMHDTNFVKKNQVKCIYIARNYLRLEENDYLSDIAILELVEPFILSAWLVPVCIDSFSDVSVLIAGSFGNVAGFGTTAVNESSEVLQALTAPYISHYQCRIESQKSNTQQYVTDDKFCAGQLNGHSKVCAANSGSGLVIYTNGRYYLRGIFSSSLGTIRKSGTAYCDNNSYSIYTRIYSHIRWIEDVLSGLEQSQSCQENSESSLLSTTIQSTIVQPITVQSTIAQPITVRSTTVRSTTVPLQTQSTPGSILRPMISMRTCKAPPQPQNGYWKLPHSQCLSGQDCDVPEGTELNIGVYLIYSCDAGYQMKGSTRVSCSFEGDWLDIPVCTEIRCRALSTVSREARCTYNDERVSCESAVLPRTRASLSCRNSYQRDPSLFARNQVMCNAYGQWEPEPMRCVPVCGKLPADVTPLIVNGVTPNITEFPWHASMYRDEPGEPKKYICGASIIQENLLITAAHCVYDERVGRISDKTIYIVTGNIFRDYDSLFHDSRLVRKNQVKNIYLMCDYIGLIGNYVYDMAILELIEPFVLSAYLVPVCIDSSSDLSVLEVGAFGKVAGFGRTAVGGSSGILQALTVPYIPHYQCRNATQNANLVEFGIVDKFCAGYSNGSSVCDGDSGSGLVFKSEGLWYLRGIVSVALGTIRKGGITHCDNKFYSLYTRVSSHIGWIKDVITRLKQNQVYPSCQEKI